MDLEERLAALDARLRTAEGWRIAERFNPVVDGSETSHDVLRRVTS